MKTKASAPGKVILLGEHFVVHGSGAILCAIDRRITVTAESVPGDVISIRSEAGSLDAPAGSDVEGPLRPLYRLADSAAREGGFGVRIATSSDIPAGVGLGSSSACCVAAAGAVAGLLGGATREKVLEMAIDAERSAFAGTSGADCTVSAYGGVMSYAGGRRESIAARKLNITIASSGAPHSTKSVVAGVSGFRDSNPVEFGRMCGEVAELVRGAPRLLESGDEAGLGAMMNRNQEHLEGIGVSNDVLRAMVGAGQAAGCGAKITGAGGGGCVIALGEGAASALEGAGYECLAAGIDFDGLIVFN